MRSQKYLWKHLITAAPVASQPCKHPPPPPPEVDNKRVNEKKSFFFNSVNFSIWDTYIRDQVTVKKLHYEVKVRKLRNFRRNISLSSIFLTSLEICWSKQIINKTDFFTERPADNSFLAQFQIRTIFLLTKKGMGVKTALLCSYWSTYSISASL